MKTSLQIAGRDYPYNNDSPRDFRSSNNTVLDDRLAAMNAEVPVTIPKEETDQRIMSRRSVRYPTKSTVTVEPLLRESGYIPVATMIVRGGNKVERKYVEAIDPIGNLVMIESSKDVNRPEEYSEVTDSVADALLDNDFKTRMFDFTYPVTRGAVIKCGEDICLLTSNDGSMVERVIRRTSTSEKSPVQSMPLVKLDDIMTDKEATITNTEKATATIMNHLLADCKRNRGQFDVAIKDLCHSSRRIYGLIDTDFTTMEHELAHIQDRLILGDLSTDERLEYQQRAKELGDLHFYILEACNTLQGLKQSLSDTVRTITQASEVLHKKSMILS